VSLLSRLSVPLGGSCCRTARAARVHRSIRNLGHRSAHLVGACQSSDHGDFGSVPALGSIFDAYVAGFWLSDRLVFTAGDFFTDPLPRADVLVMGHILHDWDLDEKRLLLRKAYDALPEAGALIVYDAIIDDERRSNAFGLLMSLNMLIETPGGFDYTGADCRAWMHEAGFRDSYVEHLVGPDSMVVGIE
jgi:hypothetical protein